MQNLAGESEGGGHTSRELLSLLRKAYELVEIDKGRNVKMGTLRLMVDW